MQHMEWLSPLWGMWGVLHQLLQFWELLTVLQVVISAQELTFFQAQAPKSKFSFSDGLTGSLWSCSAVPWGAQEQEHTAGFSQGSVSCVFPAAAEGQGCSPHAPVPWIEGSISVDQRLWPLPAALNKNQCSQAPLEPLPWILGVSQGSCGCMALER